MGVPNRGGILQSKTNVGSISLLFDVVGALPNVPMKKSKCAVCLLADVVDMWLPIEVALYGDSKVLGLVNCAKD